MSELIFKLMKSYQARLDSSLSLRKKLQAMKKNDKGYDDLHHKLMDTEIACQELDEKILKYTIELYLEKEYFVNPNKQQQ